MGSFSSKKQINVVQGRSLTLEIQGKKLEPHIQAPRRYKNIYITYFYVFML